MTKKQLSDLEQALSKAEKSALQYIDTEDGGTCNFDTPIVRLKTTKKQMAELDWQFVKIECHPYKGWYFVGIPLSGQGNRRTRMAEAAAQSLCASGYEAKVYYQMD